MPKNFSAGIFLFVVALVLSLQVAASCTNAGMQEVLVHDTLADSLLARDSISSDSVPSKNFRKEKIIAAVLAFPVPFGFTGLHRIYLGSEPWVPVAYLVTGGGGCGLLPLLDFIYILKADEEEFKSYENNPHFFMWVK